MGEDKLMEILPRITELALKGVSRSEGGLHKRVEGDDQL